MSTRYSHPRYRFFLSFSVSVEENLADCYAFAVQRFERGLDPVELGWMDHGLDFHHGSTWTSVREYRVGREKVIEMPWHRRHGI
jgi:hypothetical protein